MFDKYSQEEYDAIEASVRQRANQASPGPWIVNESDVCGAHSVWIEDMDGTAIADDISEMQNATFIAYARTDINRLLAEIQRLRTSNREYVHVILDLTMQIARTELEEEK